MAGTGAPPRSLSPAEWETLIDEYNLGGATRIHRWTEGCSVFDLCISSLPRKDLSLQLKLHLLTFLEQYSLDEFSPSTSSLTRLVDALRGVIQSPNDPFPLKDQFLISSTSIFITSLLDNEELSACSPLCSLVELLLTIINRPNHGVDRQTRGTACECLRQLELAFPCLLSEITPHLWSLCQSERTHVSQWYVLLLLTAVSNVVKMKPSDAMVSSVTNAAVPLIPFNFPSFLVDGTGEKFSWKEKESSFKELRRVVAFLLDFPQYLTPFGLLEFIVALIPIAEELELQASLLKVQFSWLLYTTEPLLYHAFLVLYQKFSGSFEGQEFEVAPRLLLLSKETQHHLVYRLLGLHWLLGFFGLIVGKDEATKRGIVDMSLKFYPEIYDPLALKALKLDALAYCSGLLCSPGYADSTKDLKVDKEGCQVNLFAESLLSVSALKHLPPWSSEAAVAFRAFHKFLIVGSPHTDATNYLGFKVTESSFFHNLKEILVNLMAECPGLVPVVVMSIDRLLECGKHCWLGEHLLETLDMNLLPKLKQDYSLGSYFLIFERISQNDKVPPNGLLKVLVNYMLFLVKRHGPGTELKSWRHGSKILSICRSLLKYRHSSSLFSSLSRLLASVCLYFPDLEIRDRARFYLRMLTCIPGKKLKSILNKGEALPGVSPSIYSGSPFNPQSFSNPKRLGSISSLIHIERVTPLLIKQSWSLSLLNFGNGTRKSEYFEGIKDAEPANEEGVSDMSSSQVVLESGLHHPEKGPFRVMDAKLSETVRVLRRHFACIPDYRHMPGLKIYIRCGLRFASEIFTVTQEGDTGPQVLDEVDKLQALYAIVLRFTSAAPYGSIPSFHIPFLLGTPSRTGVSLSPEDSLAIVPAESSHPEKQKFISPVCIELEPREPIPGMVDVWIDSNADNGQIIQGQLQSISVGIEDMFLRALPPDDIQQGDAACDYYMHLFNALWEACEASSSTGRDAFLLKGGKGVAAINGTRSVKLIEIPPSSAIQAIERHLAPFVVCVIGEALVDMVKSREVIKYTVWKGYDPSLDITSSPTGSKAPLYLKYFGEDEEAEAPVRSSAKNLGYLNVLIFLPPRFHLLFQMEVRESSTLVRIRTDHWPCLAYVDDYLEALFLGRELL